MTLRVAAHGNPVASLGQAIVVEVGGDTVALNAPFYRRSIRIGDIAVVEAHRDEGLNHGTLNWFVVGRPHSPQGVRLNTGGAARVDIVTLDGGRFEVVLDTVEQAQQVVDAVHEAQAHVTVA